MEVTRRSFVKLAGVGVAAVSMGGILSACSSSSSVTPGVSVTGNADEVVVSMTTGSEPAAGFDPLFSWGCGEHVHEPLIQSTLITTDADLNFVNDLATSYESKNGGMMWVFDIRSDVKFTDGEVLTAHDVAFTINGIINGTGELDLSMVKKAVAVSDTRVEIHMNRPFNALLYTLAVVGIVPEHAYNADTYGSNPIGSGRYMLEQWDQGQQVILKANPDYYGPQPTMKRVVVVFMEEDASLAAAKGAQVDIAYTAATLADSVPENYELLVCDSVDSRGISLPCVAPGNTKEEGEAAYPVGNEVTQDLALRRAMNYALKRDVMVSNVLNGYGVPAYSVCDNMPWYSEDMKISIDLAYAQALMEDAGWQKDEDDIYAKANQRASFTLYYSSNDSVRQALANEFSNQMKEFGIEVLVQGAGWDDLYPRMYSDPILWGWGANSPLELYNLSYSAGSSNFASYNRPEIDKHFDKALAKAKVENSFDEWKKAQWDGSEGFAPQGGASWVWLVNIDHLYFKRSGLSVADQKPHPHGHGWSLVNNVDTWSWS